MIKLNPYLNFMGKTEEAFNFYKSVFGGDFTMIQRFSDIKDLPDKDKMTKDDMNKLMHISLPVGNEVLMATDALESQGHKLVMGNNISLSISVDSKKEADRIFDAIAKKGKADMPMKEEFWGAYFGMVDDPYGIKWMISYDPSRAEK